MVGCQKSVTRGYTDVAPLFLKQTSSDVGEDRDELNPIKRENKPPEGSMSEFFFVSFFL